MFTPQEQANPIHQFQPPTRIPAVTRKNLHVDTELEQAQNVSVHQPSS
jgi:hypothetical protein